ncbi:hypothetical protein P2318_17845 [Myxococcaceae bacterium GXIMD 01537]
MSDIDCPDLEELFAQLDAGEGPALDHAAECVLCGAVLEEHRLLEKDLFRLADPLPPPSLVKDVMARVAAEPPPLRRELWTGLTILATTLVAGFGFLFTSDRALSRLGTSLARSVVDGRAMAEALSSGAQALWSTAAGPLVVVLALVLVSSLLGLKRLAGSPTPSEA